MLNPCLNFFNGALQPSELISQSSVWPKPFLFSFWFLSPYLSPRVLMNLMFTHGKLFAVLQMILHYYFPSVYLFRFISSPSPLYSFASFSFFPHSELIWPARATTHNYIIMLSVSTCNWLNCLHLSLDKELLKHKSYLFP